MSDHGKEENEEDISIFKRWRKPAGPKAVPGSVKAKNSPKTGSGVDGLGFPKLMIGTPTKSASESDIKPNGQASAERKPYRVVKFESILQADNIDMNALRKLSWNGVPSEMRPMVWQLLLGYMPTNKSRRDAAIVKKRKEYFDSVAMYFDNHEERTVQEGEIIRQILVDLPRTCPDIPFFHQKQVQRAMERMLYIWSIRHPASGYVQGMNDLVTPLLIVFISAHCEDPPRCDVDALDPSIVSNVEADTYWCLSKLLDNIQDHYTFSQPGLQRMVLRLEDLMHRIDNELHTHLTDEGIQYMQFSFRWMNCLLLREMPLRSIIRIWDTYLSEDRGGFENFHVYMCAVLLKMYKEQLMTMQFQDILMFLQDLPTSEWHEEEVEPILSQAYILSTLFEDSPSHLR